MAYKITLRRSAVPVLASVSLLVGAAAVAMPAFGDWSAPANLETLAGSSLAINTPAVDGCASQSQDGLMLAFNSSRAGNQEIFIAERPNTSVGFGDPVKLPAAINTAAIEFCPTLLPGKRMIFSSAREDPNGDLYETRLGPKGWSQPRFRCAAVDQLGRNHDDVFVSAQRQRIAGAGHLVRRAGEGIG